MAANALIAQLVDGPDNLFAGVSDRNVARVRLLGKRTRDSPVRNATQRAKITGCAICAGERGKFFAGKFYGHIFAEEPKLADLRNG